MSSSHSNNGHAKYHNYDRREKLSIESSISSPFQCIGRVQYQEQISKISTYFRTGFMISNDLVITEKNFQFHQYGKLAVFKPIAFQYRSNSATIVSVEIASEQKKQQLPSELKEKQNISPLCEGSMDTYAILRLKEPVFLSSYLSVSQISSNVKQLVTISGYPESGQNCSNIHNSLSQYHQRVFASPMPRGFYSYDIDTQTGQEGGPLLVKSRSQWTVVGVHLGYSNVFNACYAKMFMLQDIGLFRSYSNDICVLSLNQEWQNKQTERVLLEKRMKSSLITIPQDKRNRSMKSKSKSKQTKCLAPKKNSSAKNLIPLSKKSQIFKKEMLSPPKSNKSSGLIMPQLPSKITEMTAQSKGEINIDDI